MVAKGRVTGAMLESADLQHNPMARPRPPVWILLAAAAFLGYFCLLIYTQVRRPEPVTPPAGVSRTALDAFALTLPLGEPDFDLPRDGVLYGLRGAQLITLIFGIVLAVRRPRDPAALAAAWLLASAGVFSVALPDGWASAWRELPAAAGALLWLPFVSALGAGAILFVFAAAFTRDPRATSPASLAALTILAGIAVVWHTTQRMALVYNWDLAAPAIDLRVKIALANAVPAAASILLLLRYYNAAPNLVERRRAHIVLTGGSIGLASGIAVMLGVAAQGPEPGRSIFASTSITAGTVLLLLLPLSLTYAILRYRLFQWSRAIRLGLRYAVARRALLSILPLAAVLMAFDMWSFGERPLREVLSARAGVYWLIGGIALAAHLTRHRWLDQLDRTFFREVYDAKRILIDLVGEIRAARRFEDVAALAVTRIERALRPEYLLIGTTNRGVFVPVAAYRPEKAPPDDALPARAELAVPIVTDGGASALMLLGPRRSEEPYSHEDRELLDAIAASLALAFAAAPAAPRMQDVELPRLLASGRYRLERLIGTGGMGLVYEARDLTLDRRVAIKLLRDELVDSADARARFAAEARSAARVAHPNIVRIFDFDTDAGGVAMIVMEYLDGHTLRDELTGMPLDPRRALWILGGLAAAVDAAHAEGMLHRDLKPENIFIARHGEADCVKVLDFGIAKPLTPDPHTRGSATVDGAIVGTPRYMAPEQLAGGRPAPSWDLWAVAVLACEMVTGAHPFAGGTPSSMPAPLESWFRRALAPRPAERYATAHELYAALEERLDVSGV